MNLTQDFDAEFFGSPEMPLICLATSATENVSLYSMQLRSDPDTLNFASPKRAIAIPYARPVQARIRLQTRLFYAAMLVSGVGVLGLLAHILSRNPPHWLGVGSLVLVSGGWLTVGLFALFSGSFAPQITLLNQGRLVRIVFPKAGATAAEHFRLAHLKWQGQQGETGAALPADDWGDDVNQGWDQGGAQP